MNFQSRDVIDELCELCLQASAEMSWLVEPLTLGRAQAYVLQHVLRNRLFSAVIRPAWVSRCPDDQVVRKTFAQIQEELVLDPNIGRPHTDLLYEMGRNVGLTDDQMSSSLPVPLVEVAFNVWENIARTRHWIDGWLSSSVGEYIITTVPMNNFRASQWIEALHLEEKDVLFFSYHEKADLNHAGRNTWAPIAGHVANQRDRQEILSGAMLALEALKLFYRGVADLGDEIERCGLMK